jgi:putative alpha-1,2-mannosidase
MMKYAMMVVLSPFLVGNATCAQELLNQQKAPVDYVSPNIGGMGQLLSATVPYVQYPHGMARIAPITTPDITDRYLADKIYGFSAGASMLMASTGPESTDPEKYASDFDHDFETVTPYYYAAELQTWGIGAELTSTGEAAYYRFTFPRSAHSHLVFSLAADAQLSVVGNHALQGSERVYGPVNKVETDGETREYFYAEFSHPLVVS